MKIYGIADTHLGIRNKKINNKFEEMIKEIILSFDGNLNLLLIAGDLFENPRVRNESVNFVRELSDLRDDLRIIISSGNHDVSPVRKPSSLELMERLLEIESQSTLIPGDDSDIKIFQNFQEMPKIIVVSSKPTRIYLREEDLIIDSLPSLLNHKGFVFNRDQKDFGRGNFQNSKKILICHGNVPDYDLSQETDLDISKKSLRGYDLIIKGHIHKTYEIPMYNLYSPGAINTTDANSEGSYLETSINSLDKVLRHDLPKKNLIKYKVFMNETELTINNTLMSLTDNDIVSIYFNGDSEKIDESLYFNCFHNCLRFNFIFDDKNIIKGNEFISVDPKEKLFKPFYSYVDEYLEKADGEVEKIKKIYNSIRENLKSKEVY